MCSRGFCGNSRLIYKKIQIVYITVGYLRNVKKIVYDYDLSIDIKEYF